VWLLGGGRDDRNEGEGASLLWRVHQQRTKGKDISREKLERLSLDEAAISTHQLSLSLFSFYPLPYYL
jgi:hypothetical protein